MPSFIVLSSAFVFPALLLVSAAPAAFAANLGDLANPSCVSEPFIDQFDFISKINQKLSPSVGVHTDRANAWDREGTPSEMPAQSREEFCEHEWDWSRYERLAHHRANLLVERNPPGFLHLGVCWWESRLQRFATYLTVYRPDLPKPNSGQVYDILNRLASGKEVVEIPGYRDLHDFSKAWRGAVDRFLGDWQIRDMARIKGLGQLMHLFEPIDGAIMRKRMDDLYDYVVKQGKIAFVTVGYSDAIAAHSWLIVGMTRTKDGYSIDYLDSNDPNSVISRQYISGTSSLTIYKPLSQAVIALGEDHDFAAISSALHAYCDH